MALAIFPITESQARVASAWQYAAPYSMYDGDPAEWPRYLQPGYRYHAVLDHDELIGHCCFGEDARVPGGRYVDDALDVGAGMRPDLVGKGLGRAFLTAVLDFGRSRYAARSFSATVAAFNHRALTLCRSVGFVDVDTFTSHGDEPQAFVILRCNADTLAYISGPR
jgi:RimJ/RimL family protein N-acetyltransferase